MRANQSFIIIFYIPHLRRKITMRRRFYHTSYKMQYFPIFFFVCKTNCIHSIFRTIEAHVDFWLAKPFKTFPKSPIRPPVLTFDKRQICEEIFKELPFNVMKNLLSLFFFNGFITMCNLKKRLIRLAFWVLLQAMFMNGWKQTAKRWKLHFWGYQQSIKKYNSVEHLQRTIFIHENKWVFKCV